MSNRTNTTPVSPRTRARETRDRTRDTAAFKRFLAANPQTEAFASAQYGLMKIEPKTVCHVREWVMLQCTDEAMELLVSGNYEYQQGENIRYPIPTTKIKRAIVIHGAKTSRLLRIDRILEYALANPAKCRVCIIDLNS